MSEQKYFTLFDRPYPEGKQAEGVAISQAIMGGHCNKCGFLPQCSTQDDFQFPAFAWCMMRKAEILIEMRCPTEGDEKL